MLSGKRIKIIKYSERSEARTVGSDNTNSVRKDRTKTKHDAVSIVTGWVSELRRKKSEEATNGFTSVFGDAA
jgi:hypothetical protein